MIRSHRSIAFAALALAALAMADTASAQTSRRSWTSDRRDFVEGDVITVLIDEHTLAAANQGDFSSDRRFRDLGVDASGAGMPGVGASVGTTNQAESRSRSEASRQNRFQGEMTVRVVGVEEGGLLRVEGTKMINIDEVAEELVLRGLVRPDDVTPRNMVESWRIGDVELVYTTEGTEPKGGILGRLLGKIWP